MATSLNLHADLAQKTVNKLMIFSQFDMSH